MKGTKEMCIYFGTGDLCVLGCIDSDFAGHVDTKRSTFGYVDTKRSTLEVVQCHGCLVHKSVLLCLP